MPAREVSPAARTLPLAQAAVHAVASAAECSPAMQPVQSCAKAVVRCEVHVRGRGTPRGTAAGHCRARRPWSAAMCVALSAVRREERAAREGRGPPQGTARAMVVVREVRGTFVGLCCSWCLLVEPQVPPQSPHFPTSRPLLGQALWGMGVVALLGPALGVADDDGGCPPWSAAEVLTVLPKAVVREVRDARSGPPRCTAAREGRGLPRGTCRVPKAGTPTARCYYEVPRSTKRSLVQKDPLTGVIVFLGVCCLASAPFHFPVYYRRCVDYMYQQPIPFGSSWY
jgi:hypothetical protein